MKTPVSLLITLLFLIGCNNSDVEKHYNAKDNVIDVHDKLQPIDFGETYMSLWAQPYYMNDYLLITDYKSYDNLIYIFDRNTHQFIANVGVRGQGPSEITNMGDLITDSKKNTFYVLDQGQYHILSFPMDSILKNPNYAPKKKVEMSREVTPFRFVYVSDTLSYALFSDRLSDFDYKPVVGTFNMNTGEHKTMEYKGHPEVERKRVYFDVSIKHNVYVEGYWYHDLLTICSLDGKLKHVVYGSKWDNATHNRDGYFNKKIMICGDKIIATYLGKGRFKTERTTYDPTKLIVFDLEGNYISTLETGINLIQFTYDEEKNRLFITADDEMQFSYLDLDDII